MIERRSFTIDELRVSGKTKPVITGHAAVFNQKSEEIFGFREIIKPGAFKNSIIRDDIRALWNHDPNFVLGRRKADTLQLEEDDKGLAVRIHPPDTVWASDLLESLQRGDVDQMSFGFRTIFDDWRTLEGETIRELIEVELFDVSPVTFPAYPQTDVQANSAVREFYEARMKTIVPPAPPIDPAAEAARAKNALLKEKLSEKEKSWL